MKTDDNSILVGVFKKEAQAKITTDFLKDMGFQDDQIYYLMRGDIADQFHIFDNLVDLGVSEEKARHYQSECKSAHGVLVVRHNGRRAEALNILSLNGARKLNYSSENTKVRTDSTYLKAVLDDNDGTFERSLPNNSSTTHYSGQPESTTRDEMESLNKLLKNAGLDHLL